MQNECFSDDFYYKRAKTSRCCWMSEGNHSSDGELHQINGGRCVNVFLCVNINISYLNYMNMSFVFFKTDPVVSKEIFDYALKAICPQVGINPQIICTFSDA